MGATGVSVMGVGRRGQGTYVRQQRIGVVTPSTPGTASQHLRGTSHTDKRPWSQRHRRTGHNLRSGPEPTLR